MHISVVKHTKGLDLKHTSLWLGRNTQRFSGISQTPERLRPFRNCPDKTMSPGALPPWLDSQPGSLWMWSVWIVYFTNHTSRQIHHGPKDSQVVKKVSLITFTDRQHSLTTRERIKRSVRVVRLVNTLHDPYGLCGSYESTHHHASRQSPSISCYE